MKISIIIVTFNHESEIATCLHSLNNSSDDLTKQIIVIDNNSQDETIHVLESFASSFTEFRVIRNEKNLGFTRAVNQGLKIADGDFFLLLNPDTLIPRNTISRLIEYLEATPQAGAVSPQFRNPDGTIQPSCRRFPRRRDVIYNALGLSALFPHSREFNYWKMGDFDHKTFSKVEQPQGAFLLIKQEVFSKVGFLDEQFPMFFSDVDICHRIIDSGREIHFIPDVHIIHSKGSSIYNNRSKLIFTSHISFYRYFQKYYQGPFNQMANLAIGILLFKLGIFRFLFHSVKRANL